MNGIIYRNRNVLQHLGINVSAYAMDLWSKTAADTNAMEIPFTYSSSLVLNLSNLILKYYLTI